MNIYEIVLFGSDHGFAIRAETAREAISLLTDMRVDDNEFDNEVNTLKWIVKLDNE